jgi:hypothetical protein
MAIDFQHPEYKSNIDRWKLCDDICSSKNVEQCLLPLNPSDKSASNRIRNEQYRERAVFYPVAGHTLNGLVGLMFAKDPQITLPKPLEYMLNDVDGSGVSIYQQMQDASGDVLSTGRGGLFVSYPKTEGAVSKAQMEQGGYVATIHEIDAEQVINWRTSKVGAKVVLSLVVIAETVEEVEDDGYTVKEVRQLRELALEGGVFIVREWRKARDGEWAIHSGHMPTDSRGQTWKEIPFTFIGSQSNSTHVDGSPMYPLCEVNKAHYRNSADYEDSVWYVGQAQPWASGLSQSHIDLMKKNNMYVGSRTMMAVPSGETFGFASAPPNSMVKEAMNDKLEMMIGMGARFIRDSGQVKTATEAAGDSRSKYSGLAMVSANISEAYTRALQWAMQYMGATGEASVQTSMDFVSPTATAQDIQAMVAGFIQGAIPVGDYFRWLKKVDLTDSEKTLEEFQEEIGKVDMPDFEGAAVSD